MISKERIKTNHLLLDELDYWDELDIKNNNDPYVNKHYREIMQIINQQLDTSIEWLDSQEAKDYFYGEMQYQKDIFELMESQWDRILSGKYDKIEDIIEEVYEYGKIKAHTDIEERLRYTEADKLALTHIRNYNFKLIRKLDNELRRSIKNQIFQGVIKGENPNSIASKLVKLGVERLPNSTLSPRQRAVMIAKTEVSRAQNTGILQSYVNEGYEEVKILTAEDDNVCYICLKNAYEFNDAEIIYSNHGKERVHNIQEMIKKKEYVPAHPHCYMPDTEIFTNHGWKYFFDISVDDKILSLNPKTKETEFIDYLKIIKTTNVHGYMYHIHNRWFDTCITPDHDCFIYQRKEIQGKKVKVPEFRKPNELNSESNFLRIAENNNISPKYIDINGLKFNASDYSFFMAWYLSEGSVLHNPISAKNHSYPIKISQEIKSNRKLLERELKRICSYLGLKLAIGKSYFEIYSKELYEYLKPLGYCYEMYVPNELFGLSKNDLKIFLDNYVLGDGHARKSHNDLVTNSYENTITTSSINLVNDLSYIILLAGFYPSISLHSKKGTVTKHHNGEYASNHDSYCLRINRSNYSHFTNCAVDKIPYDGDVYCVELPKYHTLWTKRNNKTSWNGNCRCTYLAVWKKNRVPPEKPYTTNLINEDTHNWSYNHKGKNYQLQGNTPMSRDDFLQEYGVDVNNLDLESKAFIVTYTDDGDRAINNYLRGLITQKEAEIIWNKTIITLKNKGILDYELSLKEHYRLKNRCLKIMLKLLKKI